jgi:hypothetical protein
MMTNELLNHLTQDLNSSMSIGGRELAAIWSTADNTYAKKYYDKTVELHQKGFREESVAMSVHFDTQIHRYHEDKRSGSDINLEPIGTAEQNNKVLKDGITRFSEIMADVSAEFFYYLVSGTGTAAVNVGQRGLSAENARADMRTNGVMDSAGNLLLMRCQFPTGIPTATISEFGATDKAADPSTFAWRVVLEPSEYFDHEQGETWYTASHYLAMYAK